MHPRTFGLLAAAFASGAAGALFACSSSSSDNPPPDVVDGSADGGSGDASPDQGPSGHCSAVQGPACDLVLQDCESGLECTVANSDAGLTTACVTPGSGKGRAGAPCCADQGDQCGPGLECIGAACSGADAAVALAGRCTPHCCPGDDSRCGESDPEGFPGTCDLQVLASESGGARVPLYHVCSYKPGCKPFRIQACPADETCLLQTDRTTYRCADIHNPPGLPLSQPCQYANDCADGLYCLGSAGATTCRTMCYREGAGAPPFDASAVRNEPGYGGCPAGSACTGAVTGYPGYLGFCQ